MMFGKAVVPFLFLLSVAFCANAQNNRSAAARSLTEVRAQLGHAIAKKTEDEANLAAAKRDFVRRAQLAMSKPNSTALKRFRKQQALIARLEAQVKLDEASIDFNRTLLEYSQK